VRDDSGVYEGATVSASYDPMLAKLSVWAEDRPRALARMQRAVGDYLVGGIRTNLAFLSRVLAHPDFARGNYDIDFVAAKSNELLAEPALDAESRFLIAAAAAVAAQVSGERIQVVPETTGGGLSPWVRAERSYLRW